MPDEVVTADGKKGTCLKITAVMSCPRLGFTDNFFCALGAFTPLGIQMAKESGAYWEQSMARLFYMRVDAGDDFIFTVDYDSVFNHNDVIKMVELMHSSGADAICATELKRDSSQLLMTIHADEFTGDGKTVDLTKELLRIRTGHFGLTIIRCDSLRKLPHPWFYSNPDPTTQKWVEGRTDADIFFWLLAANNNWKVYQANQVIVGHIQRVITWASPSGQVVHQYLDAYERDGKPASVKATKPIPSLEAGGELTPRATPPALEEAA